MSDRFPPLINNRIPVDVASLNVSVSNAQLEIANDAGNPIPMSLTSSSLNLATTQDIQQVRSSIGDGDVANAAMPTGGNGLRGWLSAIWLLIVQKLPNLINGRIPVDVASLSVSVSNSQLEIANDVGNPIPVSGNIAITNFPASRTILTSTGIIATSGDNILISGVNGFSICITSLIIQLESTASTTILLKDGAITRKRLLLANQGDGLIIAYSSGLELKLTANNALVVNLSSANTVGYSIEYYLG